MYYHKNPVRLSVFVTLFLFVLAPLGTANAQRGAASEQRTSRYFDSINDQQLLLLNFLIRIAKGGDLHNHLNCAVYAESYVQWAVESGLCVNETTLALASPPCAQPNLPVSNALTNVVLYRRIIDAWSMRNWEKSGQSAHDHFFDAFAKFGSATDGWVGEMLAEVTARAARDNVSYVELIFTPDGRESSSVGRKVGWDVDFNRVREKLFTAGLREAITIGRQRLDAAEAKEKSLLRCGTSSADPGCAVTARYIYQMLRAAPSEQVFAQILAGFEMASVDSRVVGLNLVQPEDWYVPMHDFGLHMRMIEFLHKLYPNVHISLHAGELAHGLVPPDGLTFHIRQSIEIGHAERIGHGVTLMEENDPIGLLHEMSQRNVSVEVCLTSNDLILGVSGARHPLAMYLKYGVPVALATDDEGVSRSDMTREYFRAAKERGLNYISLKRIARTSLEHAFIEGRSIWNNGKTLVPVGDCYSYGSTKCQAFVQSNAKARLQLELELSFERFEAATPS
jgi:adenosine deaminase